MTVNILQQKFVSGEFLGKFPKFLKNYFFFQEIENDPETVFEV